MMKATEDGRRSDLQSRRRLAAPRDRRVAVEPQVGPRDVVILVDVLAQDGQQVSLAEHDDVVGAVAAQGPNDAFGVGVHPVLAWGDLRVGDGQLSALKSQNRPLTVMIQRS